MRCAERKGTAMMLWQHAFFMVIEPAPRGPPKPYVYQALEFRIGVHLPEEEVERMYGEEPTERSVGLWCRLRASCQRSSLGASPAPSCTCTVLTA